MTSSSVMTSSWPSFSYAEWRDTGATLQRYAQIIGKIRLGLTPRTNHFWNCALALTARGLTSRATPCDGDLFDVELDFVDHKLRVRTVGGEERTLSLDGRPVADFYRTLGTLLSSLGIDVHIDDRPVEIPTEAIPFHSDELHATYDRDQVERFWQITRQTAAIFEEFAARFVGKSSPVHFWWGSFDLALTRFSGRRAPPNPEADAITREAYSHECWSAGFWPGDVRLEEPAFYAYSAPPPAGFAEAHVAPEGARWDRQLGEFILPYETLRRDANPRAALLAFLQSSYEAAADLGHWDRESCERRGDARPSATDAQLPAL
ncbi:MAG: hypothetical protein JWN44_4721 [Myxococcales bacterium]|nr:hypothetical protein [Myxococcales bacterium]